MCSWHPASLPPRPQLLISWVLYTWLGLNLFRKKGEQAFLYVVRHNTNRRSHRSFFVFQFHARCPSSLQVLSTALAAWRRRNARAGSLSFFELVCECWTHGVFWTWILSVSNHLENYFGFQLWPHLLVWLLLVFGSRYFQFYFRRCACGYILDRLALVPGTRALYNPEPVLIRRVEIW